MYPPQDFWSSDMNKMKNFKRRFSLSVPRTETIEENEFTEQINQLNIRCNDGTALLLMFASHIQSIRVRCENHETHWNKQDLCDLLYRWYLMPLQQWSDATNWLTWINNHYFIQEVVQIYKDVKHTCTWPEGKLVPSKQGFSL